MLWLYTLLVLQSQAKYLAKKFATLIKTIYMPLYAAEHPRLTLLDVYFRM